MNLNSESTAQANFVWGDVVARTLHELGISMVFFSPGSRSTPIVLALERHPSIDCASVLDERTAAFLALGYSRRTQKPAAILCTSGSAVTNWFPAIAEASHSSVPLLFLSADRPEELQNCASGQTIDQVNLFGSVTAVAEFVGGGIIPWNIVKSVRLFNKLKGFGYVIVFAETLFAVSTFYYTVSVLTKMKKEGVFEFFKNSWNIADVFTILLSLGALILYGIRSVVVRELLKKISSTKGNVYVRITNAVLVNEYYNYVVAFTVFTTTLKFAKMIAFHKSFMQIAATFRLCFIGLSTFVVEFFIVFFAFSSFFFFTLRNDLARFRDIIHAVEYTLAMSIGKFNFDSLRQADEMTAWIFFVFSITVNMILINMMMAIINLAYEEIKSNKAAYVNKFELLEYIKRTGKEMIGLKLAEPIRPKYQDPNEPQMPAEEDATEKTQRVASEFSNKTNQLLDYIEGTYLNGNMDPETKQYIDKMKAEHSFNPKDKKVAEYGFDALFLNK